MANANYTPEPQGPSRYEEALAETVDELMYAVNKMKHYMEDLDGNIPRKIYEALEMAVEDAELHVKSKLED